MARTARRVLLAITLAAGTAALAAGPASSSPDQAPPPAPARTHASASAVSHGPDGLGLDRRDKRGRRTAAAPGYEVDDALSPVGWQDDVYDGMIPEKDKPELADLAGLPQYHAVYLYPSNKPSRYGKFARMFQADARAASAFLGKFGRAVRWDERIGTDGNRYVDITRVRSAYTAQQLSGSNQFNFVHSDLKRVFTNAARKYVAWLDADSNYCGQGHLYQDTRRQSDNNNQKRTTGVVYRPYNTGDPNSGGFCRGRTLLHEIGHTLGAIQQVAPNAFDGAHCDDDDNDVMCYTGPSTFNSGEPQFDYNSDDYWDPGATTLGNPVAGQKLPWWTVNLNKFVCPVVDTTPNCTLANTNPGY